MANDWLRLWHDMPNDPKWRTVSRVSGQPITAVISIYTHLLVAASRNVTRGHADVTTEDLASALDLEEGQVQAVLDAMQGRVLDGMELTGWSKRQPKKEDAGSHESAAKSAKERKRDQREREALAKQSSYITQCHVESRNVTIDTDKDKEIKEGPKPFALPDWVPADAWSGYVAMRKKIKKPMTDRACELQLMALDRLRKAGHDIAAILNKSTANSWTDIYPPKADARPQSSTADIFAGGI